MYAADGKPCTTGNYSPAWTNEALTYPVRWQWVDKLFCAYKLDPEKCSDYYHLCRGCPEGKKRQLEAWRERATADEERREMAEVSRKVRAKFDRFPRVPAADDWLKHFDEEKDRYSIPISMARLPQTSFKAKTLPKIVPLNWGWHPSGILS